MEGVRIQELYLNEVGLGLCKLRFRGNLIVGGERLIGSLDGEEVWVDMAPFDVKVVNQYFADMGYIYERGYQ